MARILFSGGDASLQAWFSAGYLLLSFFPPAYILGQLDDRTISLDVFKFSENHMCSTYGHKHWELMLYWPGSAMIMSKH